MQKMINIYFVKVFYLILSFVLIFIKCSLDFWQKWKNWFK